MAAQSSRTGPFAGIVAGALLLVGALVMVLHAQAGRARAMEAVSGKAVDPSQKATQLAEGISQSQSSMGFAAALGALGLLVLGASIVWLLRRTDGAAKAP